MSYTKKNLRDVDDAAKSMGGDGGFQARFATADLGAGATGVALEKLGPGQRSPFAHRHDKAEEVYVVISGSGRASLDGEIVDLVTLDAVRVAPSVVRAFEAGDDGLEVLAFGPRHEGDGEIIQKDVFAE
jgi:uncharacterized cupin superfamily protein